MSPGPVGPLGPVAPDAPVTDAIGVGNFDAGVSARYAPAVACQICAGQVPPVTVMRVVGGRIVRAASGNPTHTAVTSSGVYPTNHASDHSSPVPVLPATDRPMRALTAVPRSTTCCNTCVTFLEIATGRVRSRLGLARQRTSPVFVDTCVINTGEVCMPSSANELYALAMSRTVTPLLPSADEGYAPSLLSTPNLFARSTTGCAPISVMSSA